MTPKEKAEELLNIFNLDAIPPICIMHPLHIKQCALIAVDEIFKYAKYDYDFNRSWWEEVKEEIEKL